MSKSYSQLNQDLNVLNLYNNKQNGYYIEIGASDGITLSNTYLLEKEYNWKGICIEPIPSECNKLIINRPNSIYINKAVYSTSNLDIEFTICNDDTLLSGISANIDCHNEKVNEHKQIIIVQTITLNDILEQNNLTLSLQNNEVTKEI